MLIVLKRTLKVCWSLRERKEKYDKYRKEDKQIRRMIIPWLKETTGKASQERKFKYRN